MNMMIVCETNRGHYAVRPINWAGCWNEKGQISEALNHTAVFLEKEDAEKFAEWKNAEKDGLFLRLPCRPNDKVYFIDYRYTKCSAYGQERDEYSCQGCEYLECDSKKEWYIRDVIADMRWIIEKMDNFGVSVFLTKEEAENALLKVSTE